MFYPRVFVLALLGIFLVLNDTAAQKGIIWGGKLGTAIPLNVFKEKDDIGFADVASAGILVGAEGRWFYEKRLSLGAELNYQYNPSNSDFWDVARYGEVTAHYQMASLLLRGDYYFSHKETKPYAGIAFGGFFIFNDLTFVSSYTGSDNDRSVSYKTHLWRPGFAPEAGVLFELNKKLFLDINTKFIIIPNIPDQYETEYIHEWPLVVNKNPHGNQNHLQISMTLLFGH